MHDTEVDSFPVSFSIRAFDVAAATQASALNALVVL